MYTKETYDITNDVENFSESLSKNIAYIVKNSELVLTFVRYSA